MARNLAVTISICLFGAAAIIVSTSTSGMVISSSITTPLGWSSWFDAFLTFPLLSAACLLLLRNDHKIAVLLSLVSMTVFSFVLSSYLYYYSTAPFGLTNLVIPAVAIVPADLLVPVLVIPVAAALILSWGVFNARIQIHPAADVYAFAAVGVFSIFLACLQLFVRIESSGTLFGSGGDLLGWVSDIGVGTDFGARDFIHGVSPYTHAIPPWGGSAGLYYGPFAYILGGPFALLPVGIGAHLATAFYLGLTSVGVWKCVRRLNPNLASRAAWFIIALPISSWFLDGAFEIHAIATAVIVWGVYAYLSGRFRLACLLAGIGAFTMIVPGALIIPYLLARNPVRVRVIGLFWFATPLICVSGLVIFLDPAIIHSAFAGLLDNWVVGQNLNGYLMPSSNSIIRLPLIGALIAWLALQSWNSSDKVHLIRAMAAFYLILPFAGGYYFPFFSIWGTSVAVIALFASATESGLPDAEVAARVVPDSRDASSERRATLDVTG